MIILFGCFNIYLYRKWNIFAFIQRICFRQLTISNNEPDNANAEPDEDQRSGAGNGRGRDQELLAPGVQGTSSSAIRIRNVPKAPLSIYLLLNI